MLRIQNRSKSVRSIRQFRPEIDAQLRLEDRSLAAPTLLQHHLGLDPDTMNMPMALPQVLNQTAGPLAGVAPLSGANPGAGGSGERIVSGIGRVRPMTADGGYIAAFYRYPEGSPTEIQNDYVTSSANASGMILSYTYTSPAESTSSASLTATNSGQTANVVASTNSQIGDLADPPPPDAPVGDTSTSMITNSQISYTGLPGYLGASVTSTGSRAYQIAVTPGTPVNGYGVSEMYNISYAAPPPAQLNQMYCNMSATLVTPTLDVAVKGTDVINSVKINGVAVGASGSMGAADGATIDYTWGPLGIHVTATTPLPSVGVADTNPVTGPAWNVTYSASMGLAGGAYGTGSVNLQSTLTTNYTAAIVQQ